MIPKDLQTTIDSAWEKRNEVSASTKGAVRDAVETALEALDSGKARVAEKADGKWQVKVLATGVLPDGKIDKVNVNAAVLNGTQNTEANDNVVPTLAEIGRAHV